MLENSAINNKAPVENNTNGWQIVYTGFILILLCFFIMMTSFASLEEAKIIRFTQAFSNAVQVFESGRSIEDGGDTLLQTDALMIDKEDQMARLFDRVLVQSRQAQLDGVDIRRDNRGVIVTLADKMLFNSGEARLSSRAYAVLGKVALIVNKINVPVEIEGHTDDRPIHTKSFKSNWELSTARAVNVLRYLIAKHQVSPKRLSAVGFSMYQPEVENNSTENRALNRRVAIVFKVERKVSP